ncbi:hypothetical protein [Streptomyces sp. TLI_235]|uniref:hypothetical protein n=1 Tax=Kitasatospora sp. NPDC085879 TaxID=3154769 RepID=UPI000BD3584D|nr:hypothetical protein [Streptomyces sp. TLI_235]PBC79708.1 hypothetical protein BX265_4523 [Streptomyces sp. TLI_235]
MATRAPQYRRPTAPGLPAGVAPALLPDGTDGTRSAGGGGATGARAGQGAAGAAAGVGYDTVTVTVRHGLEAVDILRLRGACGAVLQSRGGAAISFLVPAGTARGWHLPGSSCSPGAVLLPATDPRWIMPPAGPKSIARPTDPWVLRSALCEAACTLTAGGLGPF